jgi:hypothetical protein
MPNTNTTRPARMNEPWQGRVQDNGMGPRGYPRGNGRDQVPPPTSNLSAPGSYTANLGDQEEGTQLSGADLLNFVRICLGSLDGHERDQFVNGINSLLSEPSGMDRGMRSGRRTARDRRPIGMDGSVAALNLKSFLSRFPEARGITTNPFGR